MEKTRAKNSNSKTEIQEKKIWIGKYQHEILKYKEGQWMSELMKVKGMIITHGKQKVKDVKLQDQDTRKIEIQINLKGGTENNQR